MALLGSPGKHSWHAPVAPLGGQEGTEMWTSLGGGKPPDCSFWQHLSAASISVLFRNQPGSPNPARGPGLP